VPRDVLRWKASVFRGLPFILCTVCRVGFSPRCSFFACRCFPSFFWLGPSCPTTSRSSLPWVCRLLSYRFSRQKRHIPSFGDPYCPENPPFSCRVFPPTERTGLNSPLPLFLGKIVSTPALWFLRSIGLWSPSFLLLPSPLLAEELLTIALKPSRLLTRG